MTLIKRKADGLVRPALTIFFVECIYQIQYLISISFATRISLSYLNAFSMLSFLSVLCRALGIALGETCTVLFNLDPLLRFLRRYYGGAIFFQFFGSLVIAAFMFIFKNQIFVALELQDLPTGTTYFLIWLFIAMLSGFDALYFYFVSSVLSRKTMIGLNAFALVTSTAGGLVSISLFSDPDRQFLALSVSSLVAMTFNVLLMTFFLRRYIQVNIKNLKSTWVRGSKILLGDFLNSCAYYLMPLLYSVILMRTIGGESLAAYNIGARFADLLFVLLWCVHYSGVNWIIDIKSFQGEPEWFHCLRSIRKTAIALVGSPVLGLAILFPYLLRHLYQLQSNTAAVVAVATILTPAAYILTSDVICKIRAFEKQHVRAALNFFFIYGLGLPLTYFGGVFGNVYLAAGLGIVLPTFLEGVATYFYMKSQKTDDLPVRLVKTAALGHTVT